jgi:hypothetical protein
MNSTLYNNAGFISYFNSSYIDPNLYIKVSEPSFLKYLKRKYYIRNGYNTSNPLRATARQDENPSLKLSKVNYNRVALV